VSLNREFSERNGLILEKAEDQEKVLASIDPTPFPAAVNDNFDGSLHRRVTHGDSQDPV
jgi:hypothetical protein